MSFEVAFDEGACLLLRGEALATLRLFGSDSIDALVTDPPAGVSFMQATWDHDKGGRGPWVAWLAEVMAEALRVLRPGGHGLVWALPRTSHWTAWALEDAGFEVRDCLQHHFGCLSEDTELLTDKGWVPYHKINTERHALCYDVEEGTFAWDRVQEVFVYDYADTAYRLRGDHTDQLVSRGHRCLVERGGGYGFQVAEEVARERSARVPVLEDLPGLLAALSVRDQGAGAQPDLRQGVLAGALEEAAPGQAAGEAGSVGRGVVRALRGFGRATRAGASVLESALLQSSVPGSSGDLGAGHGRGGRLGTIGVDRGQSAVLSAEDDGSEQPGVEGGRHLLSQVRQLPTDQVRAMPAGVRGDGAQGRVRDGAPTPGGAGAGASPPAVGGRSPLQPRSDRQPVGEPGVLRQQQRPQAVRASRFTRSDLVRVEPVHYVGKVWCVRVPTGAFVARRAGQVFVTGNSGFPKSHNVAKAIDKAAGAERTEGAREWTGGQRRSGILGENLGTQTLVKYDAPATEEARRWAGWGTALKPSTEFWWLVRKPLAAPTVAANVLAHSTGALNIDACRVGDDLIVTRNQPGVDKFKSMYSGGLVPKGGDSEHRGRWPPHLLLQHSPECVKVGSTKVKGCPATVVQGGKEGGGFDVGSGDGSRRSEFRGYGDEAGLEEVPLWACVPSCPVRLLDDQSGRSQSRQGKPRRSKQPGEGYGMVHTGAEYADRGGASRYFPTFQAEPGWLYQPKPSQREKSAGLDHRCKHPTQKSVELMRWLAKLITPPGGVVLDCFAGSGTTGIACLLEGFGFVGIEQDAGYCADAAARLRHWSEVVKKSSL